MIFIDLCDIRVIRYLFIDSSFYFQVSSTVDQFLRGFPGMWRSRFFNIKFNCMILDIRLYERKNYFCGLSVDLSKKDLYIKLSEVVEI